MDIQLCSRVDGIGLIIDLTLVEFGLIKILGDGDQLQKVPSQNYHEY